MYILPIKARKGAICFLPDSETEHSHCINDVWSWKSGNWSETWPFWCILKVFATCIHQKESNMVPARTWKWTSMSRQWLLALNQCSSKRDEALNGYIQCCGQLYMLNRSGLLNCRVDNALNWGCLGGCPWNIVCCLPILAANTLYIDVCDHSPITFPMIQVQNSL